MMPHSTIPGMFQPIRGALTAYLHEPRQRYRPGTCLL